MTEPIHVTRLRERTFLKSIVYEATLPSTNEHARELSCRGGLVPPALVVAEEQTAGRGRGTNRWWSTAGSLTFSLLLDASRWNLPEGVPLALIAGVAVVDALTDSLPEHPIGLHWPNDVFAGGKKIAGILTQRQADSRFITGIGINVNNRVDDAPAELASTAVSMRDLTSATHDRTALLIGVVSALDDLLVRWHDQPDAVAARFDELCLQRGHVLSVLQGTKQHTGVCRGIAADGGLLLAAEGETLRFHSGTVAGRS